MNGKGTVVINSATFNETDQFTVETTALYTDQRPAKHGRRNGDQREPIGVRFVAGDRIPTAVAEQYGMIASEAPAVDDGAPAESADTMASQTPNASGPQSTPESGGAGPAENTGGAGPAETPEKPALPGEPKADEGQTKSEPNGGG